MPNLFQKRTREKATLWWRKEQLRKERNSNDRRSTYKKERYRRFSKRRIFLGPLRAWGRLVGRASRRHARQAFFVLVGQPPSHENAGASWREHIFDVGTLPRHRRHSNSVPCTVRRKLFSGKRSISPSIGYYRLPSTILRRIVDHIDTSIYTYNRFRCT